MARKRTSELPARMKAFADAYATSLDTIESARIAGYSGTNQALAVRACELLQDDRVQAYLHQKQQKLANKQDETLQAVLTHLKAQAFGNMADFAQWDRDSVEFTPSCQLTREQTYAIKKIKAKKRPVMDREGNVIDDSLEMEIELCNKETALKTLSTYYGIDSDWNGAIATLARFGLELKQDNDQASGWRVDRLQK